MPRSLTGRTSAVHVPPRRSLRASNRTDHIDPWGRTRRPSANPDRAGRVRVEVTGGGCGRTRGSCGRARGKRSGARERPMFGPSTIRRRGGPPPPGPSRRARRAARLATPVDAAAGGRDRLAARADPDAQRTPLVLCAGGVTRSRGEARVRHGLPHARPPGKRVACPPAQVTGLVQPDHRARLTATGRERGSPRRATPRALTQGS